MSRTRSIADSVCWVMLIVGLATPAMAQSGVPSSDVGGISNTDIGVMDRARPAYDAKGVPLGAFRLFPTLVTAVSYDDNVLRTDAPQSDWAFLVAPSARLKSEWGRHFLEVYGGLNHYEYSELTGENLTDWRIGTDGRLDIIRAANVTTNVYYGEEHELWSAPNNIVGYQASPNRYFQLHADTVGSYQPSSLGIAVGGAFDNYNWTATPQIGGGYLNNDDRDENEFQSYVRAFYDFQPGYRAYIQASYDERDFDQYLDRSGLHRSSHGFRFDTGLDIMITHMVRGEIFVGYLQQNFASPSLKGVTGLDYGVQLDWFADEALTVHFNVKHSLDDSVLSGVSMADNSSVSLGADYEFRPNIIVQVNGGYTRTKFVGTSRTDDYPSAGVGVIYLVNRYASINLNYKYSERSTNTAGLNYEDNLLSLGLTLHL